MTRRHRSVAALVAAGAAALAIVAHPVASGPDVRPLATYTTGSPAFREAYSTGDLGVVKPTFASRYLVQAYRVLNGRPAVAAGAFRWWEHRVVPYQGPIESDFWNAVERVRRGPRPEIYSVRSLPDYVTFVNCNNATWETALRTLNERIRRYGGASREAAEWARAQIDVLRNCNGKDLVLPDAAPDWADALLRADRDYQFASAYFYATQYEEAARRFLAIAADTASPWRPYGRYLAARSLIRQATLGPAGPPRTALFARAEAELRRVLADPDAKPLHRSTEGLIEFIAARVRPIERVHELSARLASAAQPADNDFDDYLWLLRNVEIAPASIADDDLTDWIVTARGTGGESADRAVNRWRATRSTAWLVAALWTIPPQHPAAGDVLDAAASVPATSPAYATVTTFRLRLLIRRGSDAEARRLAASLPERAGRGFNEEAMNVVRAVRFRFAPTFAVFLDQAVRSTFIEQPPAADDPRRRVTLKPTLDDDAAVTFSTRLPLDRLVDAALSPQLPRRLRIRVAQVAFTRAVVLQRHDAAVRVAPILSELAPTLRADLSAYTAAADDAARQHAAIMLLLRTPGVNVLVEGLEDDWPEPLDEPARGYRPYEHYWWCRAAPQPRSDLTATLFDNEFPSPEFLSPSERDTAARELGVLTQSSEGRVYLTEQAIAWAREAPADPATAEALSRAVRGWRVSPCAHESATPAPSGLPLPQRAFVLLHRLHPQSDWARRTKYWYR